MRIQNKQLAVPAVQRLQTLILMSWWFSEESQSSLWLPLHVEKDSLVLHNMKTKAFVEPARWIHDLNMQRYLLATCFGLSQEPLRQSGADSESSKFP